MSRRLVLLGLISTLLTACDAYHEGKPAGNAPLKFESGATLGFEVVNVVMARNLCLQCHTAEKGNRGGVNLETYANTKAVAAAFLSEIQSGSMPIGGAKVSDADIAIIAAWVSAGAPEVSNLPLPGAVAGPITPTPTPTPSPTPEEKLDFATVQAQIFAPHCIQCHKSMATYERVAAQLGEIQLSVDTNQMPKDAPSLPIELKRLLAKWIAAGAPETVDSGGGADNGGDCDDDDDDDQNQDDDDCQDNH